jgi:hypothetical protein
VRRTPVRGLVVSAIRKVGRKRPRIASGDDSSGSITRRRANANSAINFGRTWSIAGENSACRRWARAAGGLAADHESKETAENREEANFFSVSLW